MKVAYVFVISDFLHYGILGLINKARSISDILICGVLSDEASRFVRGELPLSTLDERKNVLESIKQIDRVIVQHRQSPLDNLQVLKDTYQNDRLILVIGSRFESLHDKEQIQSLGVEIIEHEYYNKLGDDVVAKRLSKSYLLHTNLDPFENHIGNDIVNRFKRPDSTKHIISTKANTLANLYPRLKHSKIEKMFIFTVKDWIEHKESLMAQLLDIFDKNDTLIIRSSSFNEDTLEKSNAGYFESVMNIEASNKSSIMNAIEDVVNSYNNAPSATSFDQILVQRQSVNIILSGVIFTKDIAIESPYYSIHYSEGGDTSAVTSGQNSKTIKIHKKTPTRYLGNIWATMVRSLIEIEKIIPDFSLDIEFAITKEMDVVIFQVRPLSASPKLAQYTQTDLTTLRNALNDYRKHFDRFKHYDTLLLSDMAFWNPAELIGDRPTSLAYSTFYKIIMSGAWNEGIAKLGYPLLENRSSLLLAVLNKPYINVNLAIEALTPESIPPTIKTKLSKHYINKLINNPHLHDKIEFEIILSIYNFSTNRYIAEIASLSKEDAEILKKELIEFSKKLFSSWESEYEKSLILIGELEKYNAYARGMNIKQKSIKELIDIASESINNCTELGAIPFSTVARMAFISTSLLKSMEAENLLTSDEATKVQNSVKTVASDISEAILSLSMGKMNKAKFISKYGHLRAGTYNISEPNYADLVDSFIYSGVDKNGICDRVGKDLKTKLSFIMSNFILPLTGEEFLKIYNDSASSRERYKFVYTNTIDFIFEVISEIGRRFGLQRSELEHIDIDDILNKDSLYAQKLKKIIAKNIKNRLINSKALLPPLIYSESDIYLVKYHENYPNFIGCKNTEGESVEIVSQCETDIVNKIVLIERADPGFHWIFSKNIAGLLTKYGGAGSHMAVCCAEFGITAAIGCGKDYDNYKKASRLLISPTDKKIVMT